MENKRCIIVAVEADSESFPGMSALRREKIQRLRSEKARKLSAAAEMALCLALQKYDSRFTSPVQYAYAPGGKPQLLTGFPHISLSHGGNYGVAAVSDVPIGVDAEGAVMASPALMERCLSSDELERCRQSPDPHAFFRSAWVARESYVKMTGQGLTIPLSSIPVWENAVHGFPLYRFHFAGHELALCSQSPVEIRFCFQSKVSS